MICLPRIYVFARRDASYGRARRNCFKALRLSRRSFCALRFGRGDSGVNVYDGRYAIVGDFAAGAWIVFLFIALTVFAPCVRPINFLPDPMLMR